MLDQRTYQRTGSLRTLPRRRRRHPKAESLIIRIGYLVAITLISAVVSFAGFQLMDALVVWTQF